MDTLTVRKGTSYLWKSVRTLVLLAIYVLAALFLVCSIYNLSYITNRHFHLFCYLPIVLFWLKYRSKTCSSLSCLLGILFESKSITMLNHIIKVTFKTKIACYHLIDRVNSMFSCNLFATFYYRIAIFYYHLFPLVIMQFLLNSVGALE